MEIQKIYSDVEDPSENLYSVLLSEDELRMFATLYDRTDNIKRMKDSDILDERRKSNLGSYGKAAKTGLVGGALGAGVGAALGATKWGKALGGRNAIKKMAGWGAAAGGAIGAGGSLVAGHGKRQQNRDYNSRLKYAKRQALRRENRDWSTNNTQREGYTY